jgi:hypothetical protein
MWILGFLIFLFGNTWHPWPSLRSLPSPSTADHYHIYLQEFKLVCAGSLIGRDRRDRPDRRDGRDRLKASISSAGNNWPPPRSLWCVEPFLSCHLSLDFRVLQWCGGCSGQQRGCGCSNWNSHTIITVIVAVNSDSGAEIKSFKFISRVIFWQY